MYLFCKRKYKKKMKNYLHMKNFISLNSSIGYFRYIKNCVCFANIFWVINFSFEILFQWEISVSFSLVMSFKKYPWGFFIVIHKMISLFFLFWRVLNNNWILFRRKCHFLMFWNFICVHNNLLYVIYLKKNIKMHLI